MKNIFIVVSSILMIAAAVPYIIDILKRKTRPRIVSWLTWSLLTGIACAASLADRQYTAAILLFCITATTLSVVVLGFTHGDRKFDRFDIICQLSALVGLALWLLFNSPEIAIIATVVIDIIGALPTYKHAWQKPHEETWLTFFLIGASAVCTVMATRSLEITAFVYPMYLVILYMSLTAIVLLRPKPEGLVSEQVDFASN